MSARDPRLGETSLAQLHEELKPRKICIGEGGKVELKFLKLDLLDEATTQKVKEKLVHEHGGELDMQRYCVTQYSC
jgi:hypothetical protein